MSTAVLALVVIVGTVLLLFSVWALGWLIVDARERRRDALLADALETRFRAEQRRAHYLTDDPNRPE